MNQSTRERTLTEQFYAHLDECKRCERAPLPFDLCPVGARLLKAAALALAVSSTTLREMVASFVSGAVDAPGGRLIDHLTRDGSLIRIGRRGCAGRPSHRPPYARW
jgi:hypothetical protein